MLLVAKDLLLRHFKNSLGWSTKKKLVAFSVDDYGSVRMFSKEARENLRKTGLAVESNRFDMFDALEDPDDLIQLFETLDSVKDQNQNPAIFTAMSLPANPDFVRMIDDQYGHYSYELLTDTYKRIPGYEQNPLLWRQGMDAGLILPQFHGREHLNVRFLMHALQEKDPLVMACFENQSYTANCSLSKSQVNSLAAFDFNEFAENEELKAIAVDGLDKFEKVFGFRAKHFASPAGREHYCVSEAIHHHGIIFLDSDLVRKQHMGNGKYSYSLDYTGKKNRSGQIIIVRNVVFEPGTEYKIDWIDYCLKQIEIAFRWNKPVNISSHRVNFGGHIDPNNRKKGLGKLKTLLKEIIRRWPDVEFVSTVHLGELIMNS